MNIRPKRYAQLERTYLVAVYFTLRDLKVIFLNSKIKYEGQTDIYTWL